MKGHLTNYRRGVHTEYTNQYVIEVDGVKDRSSADGIVGKRVVWKTSTGKEIVGKTLEVSMVYGTGGARIHDIERVSKPSLRIYQRVTDIRTYKSGFGDLILSTPKGILTGQEAKKHKVGGEVLFKIW